MFDWAKTSLPFLHLVDGVLHLVINRAASVLHFFLHLLVRLFYTALPWSLTILHLPSADRTKGVYYCDYGGGGSRLLLLLLLLLLPLLITPTATLVSSPARDP